MSNKKAVALIVTLSVALLAAIGVILWGVFFRDQGAPPIPPDYPPQEIESNQKPLEGDEGGKLESPQGGGAINVTYSTEVTVDLSDGTVRVLYANPQASNQNVAILILVEDLVVARSELITPGHGVEELSLQEQARDRLAAGGYDGRLVVRAYHPETGEKAMIDTEGELRITVVE
jgi:hypothetical protein